MNRLVESSYDGRKESFTYDKVGNRLTKITNDITEKYVYNVKNQLKEVYQKKGNSTHLRSLSKFDLAKYKIWSLTYDKQGNTLKEDTNSGTNSFEYNALNQQVKAITKDGNTLVNRYDAEGLRYEVEENDKLSKFIFHNDEVLVETDETDDIVSRFIRGYDIVAADVKDSRYYYSVDEQGSTIFITNSNEQVKNEYWYDAFGNVLDSREDIHNRITYTGQQFDGVTGQYYLRARFYNPLLSRFTQEDSYRGDGLNLYAYCGNNPVGYYDPSGYIVCDEKYNVYSKIRKQNPTWTAQQAYNELKKIERHIEENFSSIERMRKRAGLPEYKYRGRTGTVSKVELLDFNNESFFGTNSRMYKLGSKPRVGLDSNPIQYRRSLFLYLKDKGKLEGIKHLGRAPFLSHAEANSLLRAYERKGDLGRVVLYVDRPTCWNCKKYLGTLMDELGITELNIYNKGHIEPIVITRK
ncbi:RHS repeat-associated core domain-containing protein [uncultured Clostridium sp.]|uniref:RHS repeat-associated core domain-containing protein n=1 Tax=uncultured Clostridium sp. TaxID=59620 RepID=UPI0025F79848|nr:RHS repeat-associated core domain-containing protein [uncultured Clostridium sp.]